MEHFCSFCSVFLQSQADLVKHCNSETHQLVIMSDEGRDWKFRPPARGVGSDQYALCEAFSKTGKCRFGDLCCDAHGEDELGEWKERFDYRQMKLQGAKECSLQGRHYTEQLLEKWLTAPNPSLIMTENLESVSLTVDPEMNLTVAEKNCAREWTFRLSTKASLRHVALLFETHRNQFRISYLKYGRSELSEYDLGPNCQEWSNPENNHFNEETYIVKVRFITAIYGTFRQDLVFDFGFEPILVKKLCVDVVSISDLEKLQEARDNVISCTDRWNSSELTIVPFDKPPYPLGEQEKNLLARYPPPNETKFNLTQSVMEPTLTENNYCARQHELLCIEEMSQYELLSKYNVRATLNVADRYLLTPNSGSNAKYSHDGELFANMMLPEVLSEDSASGRLVLTNCSTVLIAAPIKKGEKHKKVYQAVIEDKGKTVIYIRLSKRCCEELKLRKDQEYQAEVQFQLNRSPLCEMHFAVDRLHPPSLVFPDVSQNPQHCFSQRTLSTDLKLNPKQREAVLAITTPLSTRLPPVLIIGPFGTGKTYTLAQAVKILLDQPESRILVCTHSNSAADIYIREYLHPLVADGRFEATPLRIYYRHRWVATVHSTVQQYCLIYSDGMERRFVMPTIDDVKKHKVIVTTLSTAKDLVQLGLEKGFFTHILIDEAAQAMECEAIMPLSLANENTRLVLAGDHMQLSPEAYSKFAQQRNLHTSLLERLYDLYPEDFACKVLLCENYRSHEAIIQYTSELFYDNHLKASGQQPRHKKFYPLTFFTARGEDVQDFNSTAYHNNAEVYEIVERVIELKKDWPDYWGDQDETSIGVVTPYYDQVVRIRAELRKKKLHGVSVERVLNVQGKQFRVIFLSAVRTRRTCMSKPESDLDHGFLSNARLLNTAITRAQSLVAVVGDPVSLCSIGKCRKLWEKFILTCHKEKSLFGITWDSLRSQLDSMELKKNFILNPLAPEFIPGLKYHGLPITITNPENNFANMPPPPPQPLLLFPVPSPLQGPPLIQPTMPMMPTPHPYLNNVVNCIVPPLLPPAQPNPFQNFPFNSTNMPPPQRPTHNIAPPNHNMTRMPPAAFPRKILSNRGNLEQPVPMKEYENGMGRPIKRSEVQIPFNKLPAPPKTIEEINQNEDMKRFIMSRLEQISNFRAPPEADNFPNHLNFEEKPNKLLFKSEDAPLKNGMTPQGEFNSGLFSDHLQNNKQLPLNGVWAPLIPKSRFESEPPHSHSFEDPPLGVRTSFNDRNGEVERPQHHQYDHPHSHPMFMSENKWPNANESNNIPEPPVVNNVVPFQSSLFDKLNLLEKVLPAGTDIMAFLGNEEQTKSFLQLLLMTDGTGAAKTFLLLLAAIKKDQEMLQEMHFNNVKKQQLANRRFLSPSHDMLNPSMRNMSAGFSQPPPPLPNRQIVNNSHPEMFSNSEWNGGIEVPISPFSMPRIFPTDKFESGLFNDHESKRHMTHVPPNHWPQENHLGMVNQNGSHHEQAPLPELSKLSIGGNPMSNGDVFHGQEMFPSPSSPLQSRRRFEPDDNLRRMWSVPEFKVQEQSWPKSNNHLGFEEPVPSYLSRLRNISSTMEGSEMNQSFMSERGEGKSSPNQSIITPGPLSMSYPDIPNILSSISPGKEPPSKVIRKPGPRPNDNSLPSSFMFDMSHNEMRYPQLSSEGMTYAKIVRSPQH